MLSDNEGVMFSVALGHIVFRKLYFGQVCTHLLNTLWLDVG